MTIIQSRLGTMPIFMGQEKIGPYLSFGTGMKHGFCL